MKEILLPIADSYDLSRQRMTGTFAAQLEAQLDKLKETVQGLTTEQLEWQSRPGMNTIGMLLAHITIAEVFWIKIAPAEIDDKDEWDKIIKELIGILGHEDGMPLPKDGKHPETLAGKTVDDYLKMLDIGRNATRAIWETWHDDDLDKTFVVEAKYRFSRRWALYHILEHLAAHLGQVLILKHMMRDAGIMAEGH